MRHVSEFLLFMDVSQHLIIELFDNFDYNLMFIAHTGLHHIEDCIHRFKLNLDGFLIRLFKTLSQLLETFPFTDEKLPQRVQGPNRPLSWV